MVLKHSFVALTAIGALLGTASTGALAQSETPADMQQWPSTNLADRISADAMIGAAEVYNQNGDLMGEVEDLIAGQGGSVKKLVIEAGGFLDIGDTHFAYPISKATIEGNDRVQVTFDDADMSSYSLFDDIDSEPAAGRNWRLSELIGDWAYLKDGVRYGRVDDVIVSKQGEIASVIVYPDVTYGGSGPHAWPFYDREQGFDPGNEYYEIPHTMNEVEDLDVFVYPNRPSQPG